MSGIRELCLMLGATEMDVQDGHWEAVKRTQAEVLLDLRERTTLEALQELADYVYWAKISTETINMGLMTGPTFNAAGCDRIIAVARDRGLTVPKAGADVLFEKG